MNSKQIGVTGVILLSLMLGACLPGGPASDTSPEPTPAAAGQEAVDAGGQAHTTAESSAEDQAPAIDGQALFTANGCADCHGSNREGLFAPPLLPETLTSDPAFYVETITNGRGRMPSFADALSPDEIDALVEWLMTVSP